MGQVNLVLEIVKGSRQAASLIVDEQKSHFIRVKIYRQGKHIGQQKFTFSGTGGSRHQSMGTLVLLMKIQHKFRPVGSDSDGHREARHRIVGTPALRNIQILDASHAEHFQKSEGFRKGIGLGNQPKLRVCQYPHAGKGFFFVKIIEDKGLILLVQLPDVDHVIDEALFLLFVQFEDDGTLLGHIRETGDQA